jgi:DNA-directed RNA polymerase II subunit RPB2
MCGIVKNLALMTSISVGASPAPILQFLEEFYTENLEEISPSEIPDATKVFVNGAWVGIHRDPHNLVKNLRQMRRCTYCSLDHSSLNFSVFFELYQSVPCF